MLKKPKLIPVYPGVYIFWHKKTPLYVGKAANLKNRVSSYFKKDSGWKVSQLIGEASRLEFRKAVSEIEALIKEAELIKNYRPKYNILMRDDKNYTYVSLEKPIYGEKGGFPRFYFTHQPERDRISVGPFVSSGELRDAMRLLRSTFPYCTCRRPHRGKCVNAEIGRCPGYCCVIEQNPTLENKSEYQKNIQSILTLLSGKRNKLIKELQREMKVASKNEEYEKARKLRDQIYGLESFYQHRGIATQRRVETPYYKMEKPLQSLLKTKEPIRRIEGYDISNISGSSSTGSMVVFYEGRPDKSQYRKFKIKTIVGPNDTASHREVLSRRLLHGEWEFPDLIIIDGGKQQLNSVLPLLNRKQFKRIKIAALSKPPKKFFSRAPSGPGKSEDLLYVPGRPAPIALKSLPPNMMYLLQRIRDESHRFARAYHHVLRKKLFLQK